MTQTPPHANRPADRLSAKPSAVLVEPSAFLARVVAEVCEDWGMEVIGAGDVGAALSAVIARRPQVLFTAAHLPGLPGTALIAALKSSPGYRAIPVALLTADDTAPYAHGVYAPDAVIHKDRDLTTDVHRFLRAMVGTDEGTSLSKPPRDGLHGVRLLLADDSSCNQMLVGRFLHTAGAEVTTANHGGEVLELVSHSPFDLILMDIEMPVMDGREATRILRSQGCRLPILALTAHDPESFQEEAETLGFDGVIPKPIERDRLVAICREYLDRASVSTG